MQVFILFRINPLCSYFAKKGLMWIINIILVAAILRYEIAPSFDEFSKNPHEYLLDCSNFGIPQKRKRVIFVGYRKSLLQFNKEVKNVFKRILKTEKPNYAGYTVTDDIGDLPPLKPGEGNDRWYDEYGERSSDTLSKKTTAEFTRRGKS